MPKYTKKSLYIGNIQKIPKYTKKSNRIFPKYSKSALILGFFWAFWVGCLELDSFILSIISDSMLNVIEYNTNVSKNSKSHTHTKDAAQTAFSTPLGVVSSFSQAFFGLPRRKSLAPPTCRRRNRPRPASNREVSFEVKNRRSAPEKNANFPAAFGGKMFVENSWKWLDFFKKWKG